MSAAAAADTIPHLSSTQPRKAVVVGAGPVGCLAALALARSGWTVHVYDGRPDPRLPTSRAAAALRSINLAVSARGIAAIRTIVPDAAPRILQNAIPMKGRMIHDSTGREQSQLYDPDGQCINSLDRNLLNIGLLEEVLRHPSIQVFFQHKLIFADFDRRTLTFRAEDANDSKENGPHDVQIDFAFCVGADGTYSVVRRQLMRVVRMDFEQVYIPHEYLELKMPPVANTAEGKPTFALDPNHLHIWPRHSFMLIALPNTDKSFTCTLFAPTVEFDKLVDPIQAVAWFRSQFSDALALIGEEAIREAFRNNPRSPLIAIKANPYHYKDRAIILGDAAHSMVPFYGQGLNCGLEDVRVLDVLLRDSAVDPKASYDPPPPPGDGDGVDTKLASALARYSETRHSDLVAISDLAMANYVEMRHSVATPLYLFKRALDRLFAALTSREGTPRLSALPEPSLDVNVPNTKGGVDSSPGAKAEAEEGTSIIPQSSITRPLSNVTSANAYSSASSAAHLHALVQIPFPTSIVRGWVPLYTMVTFRPDVGYATARAQAARQQSVLTALGWTSAVGLTGALVWGAVKAMKVAQHCGGRTAAAGIQTS